MTELPGVSVCTNGVDSFVSLIDTMFPVKEMNHRLRV